MDIQVPTVYGIRPINLYNSTLTNYTWTEDCFISLDYNLKIKKYMNVVFDIWYHYYLELFIRTIYN